MQACPPECSFLRGFHISIKLTVPLLLGVLGLVCFPIAHLFVHFLSALMHKFFSFKISQA